MSMTGEGMFSVDEEAILDELDFTPESDPTAALETAVALGGLGFNTAVMARVQGEAETQQEQITAGLPRVVSLTKFQSSY